MEDRREKVREALKVIKEECMEYNPKECIAGDCLIHKILGECIINADKEPECWEIDK